MKLCERSGRLEAFGYREDFRGFGALPSPLPRLAEHHLDLVAVSMAAEEDPLDGGEAAALSNGHQECRFVSGSWPRSEGTGWIKTDVAMARAKLASLEIPLCQSAADWEGPIPEAERVAGILLPEIRLGC